MKYIGWIILVVVLIGGGYWYMTQTPDVVMDSERAMMEQPETGDDTNGMIGENANSEMGAGDVPATNDAARAITIDAKNFAYSQKEIRVKRGEPVTLTLTVSDGFHDLVVDELGVRTKKMSKGQADVVTFTPEKTGTFEYYCSVGTHRAMGMVGKIVVE